jgi:hypothetical protein
MWLAIFAENRGWISHYAWNEVAEDCLFFEYQRCQKSTYTDTVAPPPAPSDLCYMVFAEAVDSLEWSIQVVVPAIMRCFRKISSTRSRRCAVCVSLEEATGRIIGYGYHIPDIHGHVGCPTKFQVQHPFLNTEPPWQILHLPATESL